MTNSTENYIKADLDYKLTLAEQYFCSAKIALKQAEVQLDTLKMQKKCEHTFKHEGISFGGCTDSDICTKCGYEYNY